MIGTLHAYALDCPEPEALAGFYRDVLGGAVEVDDEDPGWVELILPGGGPKLCFQRSPGHVPPHWPGDDGDQQAHLDIEVEDFGVAHERLLALGARFLEDHGDFRVYLDPAGHPFCTV